MKLEHQEVVDAIYKTPYRSILEIGQDEMNSVISSVFSPKENVIIGHEHSKKHYS
jgi:hypothetical protein